MNDATVVKVCDGFEDSPDEIRSIPGMEGDRVRHESERWASHILFIVVTLGADAIEELSTGAKIEAEVEIMGGLTANERMRTVRGAVITSKVPRSNRAR